MKVTFISNFMNHHQLPFSKAMISLLGNDYTFVATMPIPQERLDMGYADINKKYDFILTTYDSEENLKKSYELAENSDIVILGSASDNYMKKRLKQGKMTFHYSERYFRNEWNIFTVPRYFASAMRHIKPYEKKPLYYLCTSAYTANDVNTFADFTGRFFKWGYFPEVKQYDIETLMNQKVSAKTKGWKNPSASILWVGRLIGWKHPDAAIQIAAKLKEKGYAFNLKIIGNGDMERTLHEMIQSSNLTDCVEMLGSMTPDEVRKHMEEADIYLFTSDFNEGWGAVLNESMNSGCAVVASHAIGSVPFLIKDGENGLIYKNEDIQDLCLKVETLLNDSDYRYKLGQNAYKTMIEHWNADVAAKRVVELSQRLLEGKSVNPDDVYSYGPCSTAELLKNNWM